MVKKKVRFGAAGADSLSFFCAVPKNILVRNLDWGGQPAAFPALRAEPLPPSSGEALLRS